jgi:hypothetical protein
MAAAVVSEPAKLRPSLVRIVLLKETRHYICIRISPRVSLSVSPWRTKEPTMSFSTFLSGPNLSAATFFAILARQTYVRLSWS